MGVGVGVGAGAGAKVGTSVAVGAGVGKGVAVGIKVGVGERVGDGACVKDCGAVAEGVGCCVGGSIAVGGGGWGLEQARMNRAVMRTTIVICTRPPCKQDLATCYSRLVHVSLARGHEGQTLETIAKRCASPDTGLYHYENTNSSLL